MASSFPIHPPEEVASPQQFAGVVEPRRVVLDVQGVSKSFGRRLAVDDLRFKLEARQALGLLGPNGAGKTTSLLLLVGALRPDAGRVVVGGRADPTRPKVRRAIGFAPQALALYPEMSAEENLTFFARLYGLKGAHLRRRVAYGLELSGLKSRARDRVAVLSGGMQRRLNIACAAVHEPLLLLLDEPTVGVDPQSRNHIFEALERLKAEGVTLIYSTHYMEEVERLCDRVLILDHGRSLASGTLNELLARHAKEPRVEAELTVPAAPGQLPPGAVAVGARIRLSTSDLSRAFRQLSECGLCVKTLSVRQPDLESVFLSLTGRTLRDQ